MSISPDVRQDLVSAFEAGLEEFTAAATAPAVDLPGLGPRPSPTELARIEARNRMRVKQARDRLYAVAIPREEAAEFLGVSSNQVSNLLASGDLIALDGPDGQRLPAWQFDLSAQQVRVRGIQQVAAAFPGGVLTLCEWMATPTPALNGDTPAELLAAGDVEAVVAAAEARGT